MPVRHENDVDAVSLPGRDHKMVVGPTPEMLGCRKMCGGVADFPPESHAPAHSHDEAEEVIYVLSGEGEIFMDGNPEPLRPGQFVYIPPKTEHSIKNDSKEVMKVLYMFSPPVVQGSYG